DTEQPNVVPRFAYKGQIAQNFAKQVAELERMPRTTRADDDVRVLRVAVNDEMLVGRHGVEAGACKSQRRVSACGDEAAHEVPRHFDSFHVGTAIHRCDIGDGRATMHTHFEARAAYARQSVADHAVSSANVPDENRKALRFEIAGRFGGEITLLRLDRR